jgi:hypothetical protein
LIREIPTQLVQQNATSAPLGVKLDTANARPRFLEGWVKGGGSRPSLVTVAGNTVSLAPARSGPWYDLQYAELDTLTGNALRAPCDVTAGRGPNYFPRIPGALTGDTRISAECRSEQFIDLCDPGRLVTNGGFTLHRELRGNRPDCWWQSDGSPPSGEDRILTLPARIFNTSTRPSDCYFMFSRSDESATSSLARNTFVEHWSGPGGKPLLAGWWSVPADFGGNFGSNVIQAVLESDRVNQYRIRVSSTASDAASYKFFDPIIYCRERPVWGEVSR